MKRGDILEYNSLVLAAQESYVSFFNNDLTCQAEYTCYWLGRQLGLPYNHKRVVRGVLNVDSVSRNAFSEEDRRRMGDVARRSEAKPSAKRKSA